MDSFSDVFERVKQLCRGEMSEVAYDLWIRELELTALDSSTACLQCTTQFKRDIVNEKYNALLTASFEEIMGFPVQVEMPLQPPRRRRITGWISSPKRSIPSRPSWWAAATAWPTPRPGR